MNFDYIEENLIYKYWKTLIRKNISNIPSNKFIKKPYLEKYIIDLSVNLKNDELYQKIINLLDSNKITNDDLCLFINSNFDLSIDEKKNVERYIFSKDITDKDFEIF